MVANHTRHSTHARSAAEEYITRTDAQTQENKHFRHMLTRHLRRYAHVRTLTQTEHIPQHARYARVGQHTIKTNAQAGTYIHHSTRTHKNIKHVPQTARIGKHTIMICPHNKRALLTIVGLTSAQFELFGSEVRELLCAPCLSRFAHAAVCT